MAKSLPHNLIEIRRDWAGLSAYERFEAFVAFVLRSLNPLEAAALLARWGRLHAVRSLVSALAFMVLLWCLAKGG